MLAVAAGIQVQGTLRPGKTPGSTDLFVDAEPGPLTAGSLDVDNFGGIPETFLDKNQNGKRVLATQDFITATVAHITGSQYGKSELKPVRGPVQRVEAGGAELEKIGLQSGAIRPARLAMFSPTVADTLILNQIL